MDRVRIEIHLTKEENQRLKKAAKKEGRSNKNFCENLIRKAIENVPLS